MDIQGEKYSKQPLGQNNTAVRHQLLIELHILLCIIVFRHRQIRAYRTPSQAFLALDQILDIDILPMGLRPAFFHRSGGIALKQGKAVLPFNRIAAVRHLAEILGAQKIQSLSHMAVNSLPSILAAAFLYVAAKTTVLRQRDLY